MSGDSASSAIDAHWTTVISGMAAKFTTRPAAVTREKKDAAMGAIAISAHSVAASSAAITVAGRLQAACRRPALAGLPMRRAG